MGERLGYRPDIDGLRAVAVVAVVVFHAWPSALPGGYAGVDVFFVISGYLIARIVAEEMRAGRFSFARFYERRARRLFPALFTVIGAGYAAAWVLAPPHDLDQYALSALAALGFAANFHFKDASGYFEPEAEFLPLLHSWSLGVEEQFYIAMPLLLWLALRRGVAARGALALAAVSFAGGLWATAAAPEIAFYMMPFRAWEFAAGAAVALGAVPLWRARWGREIAAALGLSLILAAAALLDRGTPYPGAAALLPVLGTALAIHAGASGPTLAGAVLSLRPVVAVGLVSYSLYLWHWPILAFLRLRAGEVRLEAGETAAALAAAVLLAVLSWRYVERPFRRPGTVGRGGVVAGTALGAGALAAAGLALHLSGGAPGRAAPEVLALAEGAGDIDPDRARCVARLPDGPPCRIGPAGAREEVLVLGDSHAAAAIGVFRHLEGAAGRAFRVAALPACPPALGVTVAGGDTEAACPAHTAAALDWLAGEGRHVRRVWLVARWPFYATGRFPEAEGRDRVFPLREVDGAPGPLAENPERLARGLARTVARLRALGVEVTLLAAVPEIGWSVPRVLAAAAWAGRAPPPGPSLAESRARSRSADAVLARLAETEGVRLVDPAPLLCRPDCALAAEGRPLYTDADHLSRHGAERVLGPLLARELPEAR